MILDNSEGPHQLQRSPWAPLRPWLQLFNFFHLLKPAPFLPGVHPESPLPIITHLLSQSQNMSPRGNPPPKALGSCHKVLSGVIRFGSASHKGDDSRGREGWTEAGIKGGRRLGKMLLESTREDWYSLDYMDGVEIKRSGEIKEIFSQVCFQSPSNFHSSLLPPKMSQA